MEPERLSETKKTPVMRGPLRSVGPGEEQAWSLLAGLDPDAVATKAGVAFDRVASAYAVTCFGQDVNVSLTSRNISSSSPVGTLLVDKLGRYSRLPILSYLVHTRDMEPSGQLVRPSDIPGGQIFVRGTHVLPLDEIARRFSDNLGEFYERGGELGGARLTYGDMSLRLLPFPRFPIVLIVWSDYEEFPAHATLLLDASCALRMPTDVIWATTMVAVELMLL